MMKSAFVCRNAANAATATIISNLPTHDGLIRTSTRQRGLTPITAKYVTKRILSCSVIFPLMPLNQLEFPGTCGSAVSVMDSEIDLCQRHVNQRTAETAQRTISAYRKDGTTNAATGDLSA